MSIINDALKKVQTNLTIKKPPPATAASGEEPAPQTSPSDNQAALIIISIMICLLLAGTIAFVLSKYIQARRPAIPTPQTPETAATGEQPTAEEASQTTPSTEESAPVKPVPRDGIQVQGVMTMEDRTVVLINDEIYELGETVQGMTIVDATIEDVTFLKDGETITRRVNRPE